MVKISNERDQFSQRLQAMLRQTHHSPDSPTELAREFNIRFSGPPITVHAARKWLVGEAIPTQDKMRALAEWLVVPADWLRFGGVDTPASLPVEKSGAAPEETFTRARQTRQRSDRRMGFVMVIVGAIVAAATEPAIPALLKPLLDSGFKAGTLKLWLVPVAIIGIFVVRGLADDDSIAGLRCCARAIARATTARSSRRQPCSST